VLDKHLEDLERTVNSSGLDTSEPWFQGPLFSLVQGVFDLKSFLENYNRHSIAEKVRSGGGVLTCGCMRHWLREDDGSGRTGVPWKKVITLES